MSYLSKYKVFLGLSLLLSFPLITSLSAQVLGIIIDDSTVVEVQVRDSFGEKHAYTCALLNATSTPTLSPTPTPSLTTTPSVILTPSPTLSPRQKIIGTFNNSWEIPVSELEVDPTKQGVVDLWYEQGSPAGPGNINVSFDAYTYPVYIVDGSEQLHRVHNSNVSRSNMYEQFIPFNSNWRSSFGNDSQLVIFDLGNDTYYEVYDFDRVENNEIFAGRVSRIENFSQSNGQHLPSRGVGLVYFAMLVTPEEVASGVITHALSMPINRELTSRDFVAPAIKSDGDNDSGIPEGTRFALTMTDAELEAWILTKSNNMQPLARALGYALRDYGWVVTDKSGSSHIQIEDFASAQSRWGDIGVDNTDNQLRDLLDGLLWEDSVVLKPR